MVIRRVYASLAVLLMVVFGSNLAAAQETPALPEQNAEGQWIVPLQLSGYDTFRLNGQYAQRDMFLRVPAPMQPVELRADVRHALDVQSGYVEIYSGDALLTQVDVIELTDPLVIPLDAAEVRGGVMALKFVARLKSSDDICATSLTGAWFDLLNPVLVLADGDAVPATIADFLPAILTRLTLVLPDTPTPAEAEAALTLSALVTQRYAGSIPEIVIAGEAAEAATPFERTIIIRETSAAGTLQIEDGNLLLEGTPENLREQSRFLGTFGALAAASQVDVLSLTPAQRNNGDSLSLAALGFTALQVTGQGRMEMPLNFSQSDLGGTVQAISAHLMGSYTPVTDDEDATLAVLFNETLIKAISLDTSGSFDLLLPLPTGSLQRDNTLTLRFDYMPKQGQCRLGASSFTGQLSAESTLQITRGADRLLGFERFPQNLTGGFKVAFSTLNTETLTGAIGLITAMQQASRHALLPEVTSWDDALAGQGAVVLITDQPDQLGAITPLMTFDPVKVNDDDGLTLVEFKMTGDLAMLQAFKHAGRDVLLALYRGDGLADLTATLSANRQGWYGLTGDVVFTSGQAQPTMLALQTSDVTTAPLDVEPVSFFEQYRLLIFAGLVLLVIVFAWLAYPRVVRSSPSV